LWLAVCFVSFLFSGRGFRRAVELQSRLLNNRAGWLSFHCHLGYWCFFCSSHSWLADNFSNFLDYSNHSGNGCSFCLFGSFTGQTFCFQTLTTTFTRIVQRASGIRIDGSCSGFSRCSFNDRLGFCCSWYRDLGYNRSSYWRFYDSFDLGSHLGYRLGNRLGNRFACSTCCRFSGGWSIIRSHYIGNRSSDSRNNGSFWFASFLCWCIDLIFWAFYTGFTLAITTVAATTLTARAATWAITALCAVSTFGCFIL
jgi:hypothetical protein